MDRAADDPASQPLIVLRVVIRSPDLETFVSKYSRFVKDDRIFIFTKSSQPPGTHVRFTLELADGLPLINGEGTVTRIRPDSGDASKPPGMELRFQPLDDASQKLLQRMHAARDQVGRMPDQATAPIEMGMDSQPIAIGGRFRDETTDVDDKLLPPPLPPRPPVIESHPVLEPLQKTGNLPALPDLPDPRQDESGAVTLAQGGPVGARTSNLPSGSQTAPDDLPAGMRKSQMPSIPGLPSIPGMPPIPAMPTPPPPPLGSARPAPNDERQSGGFSTPTPLPLPIPAAADDSPSQLLGRASQLGLTSPQSATRLDKLAAATRSDDVSGGFAPVGPAPPFAEAFKEPLAAANGHLTPPNGTVPANPFSEVSDGAIEYFVEWSLEQSTAPRPKAAASSFANVAMATPRAEKRRTQVRPLLLGIALGLLLGLPIGGAAVWMWRPMPAPVIVEQMPSPPALERRLPVAREKAEPEETATAAAKPVENKAPPVVDNAPVDKPTTQHKPAEAKTRPVVEARAATGTNPPAEDSEDKPAPPTQKEQPKSDGKPAAVSIVSHPAGAAVSIDGEARGKTPLAIELPPGSHEVTVTRDRYATLTETFDAPAKLDLTLKRPQATLHVDSDPPGGDVIIEGKPHGKTPVDVTLEAFHHYDVQVTLLGTKPFKKRIQLKPPQVSVDAKLEVVHK